MKYNFDEVIDRRNTNSLKWDVNDSELPMWVADMDFKTAPCVIEAIERRLSNGVLGYNIVPDEWYESIISWWDKRHGIRLSKEWLIFSTGVIPALSSIVRKLTTPAEKIVMQTPCYNIFFNSTFNNGRIINESPLINDNGSYKMDFDDLEKKLSDPQTSMMILCNPQNPVGLVWDRETLNKVGELCHKYNVLVVSDEIHCDITKPGVEYTPFASVSEICAMNSVTLISASKAFNCAGLQSAAVSIPNPVIRHKVWRGLNTDEVAEPNSFACQALIAAFTEGEEWLEQLREYLWENRKIAEEYINKEIPILKPIKGDATYLLWIDCNSVANCDEDIADYIRKTSGLYVSSGEEYGNGKGFIRFNLAAPRSIVEEGLKRLKQSIDML